MNRPYLLHAPPSSVPPQAPPQYAHFATQRDDDDEFVLGDLFGILRRQVWWILAITLVITLLATLFAILQTKIYSADALLQVEPAAQNMVGLTNPTGQATPTQPLTTDAQIELLKSRSVLGQVVNQFQLNFGAWPDSPPLIGTITDKLYRGTGLARPWFGLNQYAWGGEEIHVDSIDVPRALEGALLKLKALPGERYELSDPSGRVLLDGAVGQFEHGNGVSLHVSTLVGRPGTYFTVVKQNELTAVTGLADSLRVVERGKDTGVLQISLDGADPQQITDIINAATASFVAEHLSRKQEESSRMLTFLNGEVPKFKADLEKAEAALAEYRAESGSMAPTNEAQTYLAGGIQYEQQMSQLRLQRTQLLQRFTENSDVVRSIDTQLAQLGGEKARLDARFNGMPADQRAAVALERNAKVAEEVYVQLVNKTQELSVNRAGTIGNVHVVDEALRPSVPIKPNRALIISGAVMFGLIVGCLFAFVRQNFFSGVDDPDQVERSLHLPIFGSISYSVEQARFDGASALPRTPPRPLLTNGTPRFNVRGMVVREADDRTRDGIGLPLLTRQFPHDMTVEALRNFRTALQFGLADAPNRVVALTGPGPSVGKSFLAVNLAVLMAEAGKRVLLVDADLRRGHLGDYFGRRGGRGLSELLSGQIDPHEALVTTGMQNLHFIGSGAHPPNPSELLMTPRLRQCLEELETDYDIILIDTPPVLAVTDASLIAHIAGMTVMVLRSGAHTEREIAESLKRLDRAGARVLGGVFNAVPGNRGQHGYEYAYTYQYHAGPR
ncbi:Tyrosine-protein kinase wzc [Pararobbsia alpina]|uniref:Tyrosine-protein kinase wzc n=1 Tax=Pararobbsia alpina TaxID=621374 RepID=A0A6S7C0B6_9BURK|nr:Tyrosine-protein kinase wzc [Pararobbsia alpina]